MGSRYFLSLNQQILVIKWRSRGGGIHSKTGSRGALKLHSLSHGRNEMREPQKGLSPQGFGGSSEFRWKPWTRRWEGQRAGRSRSMRPLHKPGGHTRHCFSAAGGSEGFLGVTGLLVACARTPAPHPFPLPRGIVCTHMRCQLPRKWRADLLP